MSEKPFTPLPLSPTEAARARLRETMREMTREEQARDKTLRSIRKIEMTERGD